MNTCFNFEASPFLENTTRLGVILPSVNTVVEPWYNTLLQENESLHVTRMFLDKNVTPESLKEMDHVEGMHAAKCITSCKPEVIAYCCTASSIVQGPEYDKNLKEELKKSTGTESFTAVGAIVEALEKLKVKKISIASPYTDNIDHAEKIYFEQVGFSVLGTANFNISDSFLLAAPKSEQIIELSLQAWHPASDALLISCLNMNSQFVADQLEKKIGRPVITSTTATLWKLLRSAGITRPISGFGCLLSSH